MAPGKGIFVAGSYGDSVAVYSTDGIIWSNSPTGMPYSDDWSTAAFGIGKFVSTAVWDNYAAYSSDGMNWFGSPTGMPETESGGGWVTVAYGNGVFVAIPNNDIGAAYSTDGINWSNSPGGLPSSALWYCLTYGNGVFVAEALGDNKGAYSTNGVNWSPFTLPYTASWQSSVFGNGVFVSILGGSGYVGTPPSTNLAYYSFDGTNWMQGSGLPWDNWARVTYGNGMFVAIACYSGGMAYSTNGTNWTPGSMPDWDYWYSCAYEGGMFVALSYDNVAAYSTDGKNWTNSPSGLPDTDGWGYWYAAAGGQPGGYLTNGLVAYWKLNEAAGSTAAGDWSGNGVLLPLIGSPSWGSNYLNLVNIPDGINQYGDAGPNALTSLDDSDMTICAWINKTGSSLKGLVAKDWWDNSGGYGGWSFTIRETNNLEYSWGSGNFFDQNGKVVPLNDWAFVTVVWHTNNYQADFYINGIATDTSQSGGTQQKPNEIGRLEVGNYGNNNQEKGRLSFDGSIRDVAIYNQALTATEVQTNYLNTMPTTNVHYPDLLYYKMTEYPADYDFSLFDSSTHSNTPGYAIGTNWDWTTNVADLTNKALHFHGDPGEDNYIDTSNSVLFNFTTNLFTINLWVEPTGSYNHYLLQNCDSGMINGWYVYYDEYGIVYFATLTNGVTNQINTGAGEVGSDLWNMVTIVRTSLTNAIIYKNGLEVVSGYITSPSSSTSTLKLSVDPTTGTNLYDGNIWLTQIWEEPLRGTDVANLYHAQTNGIPWP